MKCENAAEFVSALYDGETVSSEAAEHIGHCPECQARLRAYIEMGIELRRIASLEMPEVVTVPEWTTAATQQGAVQTWWQKGWETMRIPRFAFAAMVAGILVLASGLAMTRVRARSEGSVVMLRALLPGARNPTPCPLSLTDKTEQSCGMSASGPQNSSVSFNIQLLGEQDGRLTLGIRTTAVTAAEAAAHGNPPIMDAPQNRYAFTPGETLRVAMGSFGDLQMTGEWTDHMPALNGEIGMDPGPNDFRFVSPLLIQEGKVIGDWEGASGFASHPTEATVYTPGIGRFQFYDMPHAGAVEGKVDENRVSFEIEGQKYQLVTGIPITRATTLWVKHNPSFRPDGRDVGVLSVGRIDPND